MNIITPGTYTLIDPPDMYAHYSRSAALATGSSGSVAAIAWDTVVRERGIERISANLEITLPRVDLYLVVASVTFRGKSALQSCGVYLSPYTLDDPESDPVEYDPETISVPGSTDPGETFPATLSRFVKSKRDTDTFFIAIGSVGTGSVTVEAASLKVRIVR